MLFNIYFFLRNHHHEARHYLAKENMYSKHFDSKEFLLQIMISFEAETEQLLKFKQTNIK